MTREELLEAAVDCANSARRAATHQHGADRSEAWSRAGMLFVEIAKLTSPPRPPLVAAG